MIRRTTIDYSIFTKAGFDNKTARLLDAPWPNSKKSTRAMVYNTASKAPVFQNQHLVQGIVSFTVDFFPLMTGKDLLVKAYELVQEVHTDTYKAEPFTFCSHKKDGSIDKKITINDVIVQQVELFLNRKYEAQGEMGPIRIRFTLQGIDPSS
ncbi:hypothetical protein [Candidatus Cardinium hertigii]|uniref:Uncharacterized protein n=1 Tax=Candidatus Cardinium hertigii TaxID=247481 RepID=A0A2Z3L9U3_9BACT|nr:hypothetical protein [Candidatus Cardinium hertigii]AWN82117.1 hypothetical protein DK880_00812 [Candidatus Cardinium hertigii]